MKLKMYVLNKNLKNILFKYIKLCKNNIIFKKVKTIQIMNVSDYFIL